MKLYVKQGRRYVEASVGTILAEAINILGQSSRTIRWSQELTAFLFNELWNRASRAEEKP